MSYVVILYFWGHLVCGSIVPDSIGDGGGDLQKDRKAGTFVVLTSKFEASLNQHHRVNRKRKWNQSGTGTKFEFSKSTDGINVFRVPHSREGYHWSSSRRTGLNRSSGFERKPHRAGGFNVTNKPKLGVWESDGVHEHHHITVYVETRQHFRNPLWKGRAPQASYPLPPLARKHPRFPIMEPQNQDTIYGTLRCVIWHSTELYYGPFSRLHRVTVVLWDCT
ncbi:hypothetical protein BDZ91DRAFT_768506 [Kalaharituber pfeilii]|nr:hypothetical protein BDZ91DRAFT_768506 [Kalaharituber pfeilii]